MKRNESLQALRGIGFLAVFFYHAGVISSGGTWGVSLFFILSGFLLMQRDSDQKPTFGNNTRDSLKRIAKLYPLHIVMTLVAVPLFIVRTNGDSLLLRALKVLLNVSLFQSWFPWVSFRYTMNNLSWFLSVMMFLYFMFPWIREGIGKITNRCRAWLAVSIWLVMIVIGYIISRITPVPDNESILQGLTYNNPIYRLGDFTIGCCVGAIYRTMDKRLSNRTLTVLEALTLLLSIAFILIDWNAAVPSDCYQWWKPCLFMLPVIPAIWLFARSGGGITKLLSKTQLVQLGNISGQAYLIHELVQIYLRKGLTMVGLPQVTYWLVLVLGSFAITVMAGQIWIRIEACYSPHT